MGICPVTASIFSLVMLISSIAVLLICRKYESEIKETETELSG